MFLRYPFWRDAGSYALRLASVSTADVHVE